MEITICETAGLCAGAERAYNGVIDSLSKNKSTAVYKEILHNENLIVDLERKGAKFHDKLDSISKGDFVVLRAHGEEKKVYDYLHENMIEYFDSICINVKNVRELATKKEQEGYNMIVIGKQKDGKYHSEILGLVSFLKSPIMVSNSDQASGVCMRAGQKYFAVCQTTYPAKVFDEIINILRDKANESGAEFEYKNTICSFTAVNNQKSKELAGRSDIAIVVGSKNSSNTIELVNAVKSACYTIFSNDMKEIIGTVKEHIESKILNDKELKICILAGASTLKKDLQNLKNELILALNKH